MMSISWLSDSPCTLRTSACSSQPIVLPLYYQVLAFDQGGTVLHFRFPQHGALDGDVQLTLSCLLIFRVALYQHMYPHVLLTYLFKKYIIYWFCVCVCIVCVWLRWRHVHTRVCVWSEDNFGDLVLSFHHVEPRYSTQINNRLGNRHLDLLSHFMGPFLSTSWCLELTDSKNVVSSTATISVEMHLGAGQTPPRKVTKMARGGRGVCGKKLHRKTSKY